MNVKLSDSNIATLKEYSDNDTTDNSSNKRRPDGTENIVQKMTTILSSPHSTSPPNVSASEIDLYESPLSLMKFVVTLIIRHYSNQSSCKLQYWIQYFLLILISTSPPPPSDSSKPPTQPQ